MEDFEEWKAWFDSHKEPDGTINLDKRPHLVDEINRCMGVPPKSFDNIPENAGHTVNFNLAEIVRND